MKPAKFEKQWKAKFGNALVSDEVLGRLELAERFIDPIPRPAGALTPNEYAALRNKDRAWARYRLEKMAQLGKAKRHKSPGSRVTYYTFI